MLMPESGPNQASPFVSHSLLWTKHKINKESTILQPRWLKTLFWSNSIYVPTFVSDCLYFRWLHIKLIECVQICSCKMLLSNIRVCIELNSVKKQMCISKKKPHAKLNAFRTENIAAAIYWHNATDNWYCHLNTKKKKWTNWCISQSVKCIINYWDPI